ncbi:alpha/beta hydrolase family protein [Amycolatopsis nigrescens]|uniref:alpha/beta hydrolase family protein n=1 Tax=Amycolatopsis nigrescens TaxID=381445 RepID=UPI00058D63DD|nr:dienelactone hydrolase family protein [Amycolatopsis nigrescens]
MPVKARKIKSAIAAVATFVLIGTGLASAGPLTTADNPFQRGPEPTTGSIEAEKGPFAVTQAPVPPGDGFSGGTLTYPNDTSQGTFGAVAISPGFISPEFLISWYGPRLASQGFVVLTISTNTPVDTPSARADQLLAALKYLVEKSPAKDRIDPSRLAVMGHSMGGGGTLEAAGRNPALRAAIPLHPFHIGQDFSKVSTPTLVIGGQVDFVAPAPLFAVPFYDSLKATSNKGYIEIAGGSHFDAVIPNVTIAKYSISWLKRFVDNDTRYEQFLCPLPKDPKTSAFKGNCPHT